MHVIYSGQKIMQLLLDLSTYSKGDFPFKFNTAENQNYVGPLPAIENYNPNMKSEKVRNDLITWHSKLRKVVIFLTSRRNVHLLCSGCYYFTFMLYAISKLIFIRNRRVDPFCYCTIAASVMAVYRAKYLKEKTID